MRHEWRITTEQAREIQSELAKKITIQALPSSISKVAGFDVSYQKEQNKLIAGMVVLAYPSLELESSFIVTNTITFPYIPGYLSFREAPALLQLIDSYASDIDIFVFDGHGVAHPRKLGIASHIGVLIQKPCIGCAKKKLVGNYQNPEYSKGAITDLEYKDEIVGKVVRTKDHVKPVFVSVGNFVNLNESVQFMLNCCYKYRIPEPTRQAHLAVTKAKLN